MSSGRPLAIGVDGYNLALRRGTGVSTYGRTLCRAVIDSGHSLDLLYGIEVPGGADAAMREAIFFSNLPKEDGGHKKKNGLAAWLGARRAKGPVEPVLIEDSGRIIRAASPVQVPDCDRLFSEGGIFRRAVGHFRRTGSFLPVRIPTPPAIMHWTYPLPIELIGSRNVYTLHDLVPLRMPFASTEDKAYYERLVRACTRPGSVTCTVSEASRADIITLLGADPDSVVNLYQPMDGMPAPSGSEDVGRACRMFGLQPGGYFLFFGAIEPKKNLARLIEAFFTSGVTTPLVIVRAGGWDVGGEGDLIAMAAAQAPDKIRVLDYLPRSLLLNLIESARGVLFPALHEGFGLPALEALSLGVPLLASQTGALPEITGDAALLVDPFDVGAIARAIRTLDGDAALRMRLAAAGPARAELFSMAGYRDRLDKFYNRLAMER